ncbi:MAG: hypothetical protein P8P30_04410 [Rickettsiales bacterium]|nr:hypothetical protein [Rickettsiales bacterium]
MNNKRTFAQAYSVHKAQYHKWRAAQDESDKAAENVETIEQGLITLEKEMDEKLGAISSIESLDDAQAAAAYMLFCHQSESPLHDRYPEIVGLLNAIAQQPAIEKRQAA